VTFTPSATGAVAATPLNVAVGSTTLPLAATGTGVQPLYLSTSTLGFGNEGAGVTSAPRTVYVYNYSGRTASATVPGSTGPFGVAGGASCASLATNTWCSFTVTFTPAAAGAVAATPLNVVVGSTTFAVTFTPGVAGTVVSTPLNVAVGSTTLPLAANGAGVQPLYLSVSTLGFGNEGVGVTSAPKTVYVYNYSGSTVSATVPGSTGPFAVAGGASCANLATNTWCSFTVTFTPSAAGAVAATPLNVAVGSTALPLAASGTGK